MQLLMENLCQFLKETPLGANGVFTHIPMDAVYPFISLELVEFLSGFREIKATIQVTSWSAYKGLRELVLEAGALVRHLETWSGPPGRLLCFRLKGQKWESPKGETRAVKSTFEVFGDKAR